MAQLSRPYQLALVAVALLAAVWLVALRGHSSSGGSGSGASSPPAQSAAKSPASPSSASHGSAPGLQGLTRDVAKARGAVATSQQNAKELQEKSAQASSASPSASGAAGAAAAHAAAPTATAKTPGAGSKGHTTSRPATSVPSNQRTVEAELARGEVVVLAFLNPKGADDRAVRREVQAVRVRGVAVHEAGARQVASFGSVTRGVQVYSTPTVLVIDSKGQATVITGLTDSYSLRQAVSDARHA